MITTMRKVRKFQSLFFWMALWKIVNDVWTKRGGEFQSLFFWMALWKILFWDACRYSLVVSILVFLDGALKANELVSDPISGKFQSLFFWMALWKTKIDVSAAAVIEFQSLFFWMALWKDRAGRLSVSPGRVSILVFLDGALKDRWSWLLTTTQMFQSLFFWMALWKCTIRNSSNTTWCFNPCFSGWRSERAAVHYAPGACMLFQSLFFWMALWKSIHCYFWKSKGSFNPCFSGWRSERWEWVKV